MKWNSLHEKSDWLFRQVLNKEKQSSHEDSRLEDIARKFSDDRYLRRKIEAQERFDYLKAYHKNITPTKITPKYTYVRIAVAILILIGSGTYIYTRQEHQKNKQDNEIYLSDIHPGKQQALLITHNGQKIELNRNTRQTIEQNGTKLQIDTTGLQYKPTTLVPTGTIRNTLIVPRGGEFTLTLSDGTKVWLNSDSQLTYPVNFTDSTREVTISGEAYFSVNHSDVPFIVKTDRGNITVLGTEFNVNNYPGNRETTTTLVNGRIAYIAPDGEKFILTPDQQIVIKQDGQKEIKIVDSRYSTSWKNGMFLFQEMRLEDIMNQLERWYDIHVFYRNEAVKNLHFSGDLSRFKNISTFIEMFEKSSDIKIEVRGKNIIVGI
ncbi:MULTISPECIES: FecR family protein [Butyricimonas]|uniref:FecR family protein n=1 Tax=Butyricimonas TaxID=574697 RepID=UPI001D074092|nr:MULTISPECIES: FecR family protein [Butyricimonas]MCB6972177.1 FecR family protein [Butyricimonas synergistica]MCG4519260.1 FecR family protein [Butyricimonas sp. DFI.6.44]